MPEFYAHAHRGERVAKRPRLEERLQSFAVTAASFAGDFGGDIAYWADLSHGWTATTCRCYFGGRN